MTATTETFRQVPDWLIRREGVQLTSRELDVVLVIASFQGGGEYAFPKIDRIAGIVGLKERQTRNLLDGLVERGYVERARPRRAGSYEYDVRPLLSGRVRALPASNGSADRQPTAARPATDCRSDRQPTAGPKEKQLKEKQGKENARDARDASLTLAEEVLDHYRQRTGQQVLAHRANGKPSEELKLVADAMRDRPGMDAKDWRDVIDRNLAGAWWADEPTLRMIFGERHVVEAIACDGEPKGRRAKRLRGKADLSALERLMGRPGALAGDVVDGEAVEVAQPTAGPGLATLGAATETTEDDDAWHEHQSPTISAAPPPPPRASAAAAGASTAATAATSTTSSSTASGDGSTASGRSAAAPPRSTATAQTGSSSEEEPAEDDQAAGWRRVRETMGWAGGDAR